MPAGSFTVDTARTFAVALFMGSGPKMRFQSTEQDVSASGERKWEIQVACTWFPEYGMAPASDVIRVTCLGGTDPAEGINPGTLVEFTDFKVGISAPERTEKGVRGGRPYYGATAVRPAGASGMRPVKSDAA
jgi:hypothetical protein